MSKVNSMPSVTARLAAALAVIAMAFAAHSTTTDPVRSAASLPPADVNQPVVSEDSDYRIGPYDMLDISVFQVDILSRTVQVDGSGNIEFPMLGELKVAGKTARQVGDEIAAKLDASYVRSPQVSVSVKDSASQKFTVEGAVKASGVFPLQGHMTLLRAIAVAQGVAEDAKERDVVIFRQVDHKRVAGIVNLGDVGRGKVDDPQIYAGDVIVVPVSGSRRFMKDLIAATPLLFFAHP